MRTRLAVLLVVLALVAGFGPTSSGAAAVGSCDGFRNRIGMTSKTITIANVADLTGPVPQQYLAARQAVRAYVRYFNASFSICGRKLRVLGLDSATDPASDRSAYTRACTQAFAAIGSVSLADAGGATKAQQCGLPDLRAQTFSTARAACSTCFATQVDQPGAYENAVPDFFLGRTQAATQKAARLYLNAEPWTSRATTIGQAETARGWHFLYSAAIDVADFNYGPYAQQLKSKGVQLVQWIGPTSNAIRLAQAMQSAGYAPQAFLLDPSQYSAQVAAEPVAAGAYVPVNFIPFAQAASNAELSRYVHWLHEVDPSATPTPAGLFAWSAARLFTQRARALGARLTRARLVAAVRGVRSWTDGGAHAKQDVGGKSNGNCWRFLRLVNGRWVSVGGTSYLCSGATVP